MEYEEIIGKHVNQQLLEVRKGSFFREMIERAERVGWDNMPIQGAPLYEALDALEQRVEALESRNDT